MKKLHKKKTLWTVLNSGNLPPYEHQLTMSTHCLSHVVADCRYEVKGSMTEKAEEPENLGLLAEIENSEKRDLL